MSKVQGHFDIKGSDLLKSQTLGNKRVAKLSCWKFSLLSGITFVLGLAEGLG